MVNKVVFESMLQTAVLSGMLSHRILQIQSKFVHNGILMELEFDNGTTDVLFNLSAGIYARSDVWQLTTLELMQPQIVE